ncbi:HlyC/CorC family transporter [Chakrabartia godavariana]|nr:HlyC/CorC family transporter [Chakrabartia godavariana]
MSEDASSGRSWFQSLRSLVFRREPSLRDQIEDAIEEAEDGEAAVHGDLSAIEREMLLNLLHFGERTVGDIAVPRSDIIAVPTTISFADLVKAFADAGHSRLPVYRDNLDDVSGMVHIKDVFAILARNRKPPATITKLIRQPLYVPAARGVLDVLADMRAKRIHLAIVIDEYSGTEGLVTIEDIVEEIVGDIEDEHDDAPVEMLVNVEDGIWEADARAELEDVANIIDPRLGEVDEDVDTLGGLAFVLAGHVPQVGEVLAHDSGWRLEITEGDERRVTRVRLHAPLPDVASAK